MITHLAHTYTCAVCLHSLFDQITEKYGLYKVETIGDSYMLVGGAPEERTDHAAAVAAAALEMKLSVPLLQVRVELCYPQTNETQVVGMPWQLAKSVLYMCTVSCMTGPSCDCLILL